MGRFCNCLKYVFTVHLPAAQRYGGVDFRGAGIWHVNFCRLYPRKTYRPTVTGGCTRGLPLPFKLLGFCTSQTLGIIFMYSEHDLPPPH